MIPDSKDKAIRIEKSKCVIFEEQQVGALGDQARFCLNDN